MRCEMTIPIRIAAHLQVEDFMCRVCNVQATRETDHVCESCKSMGKSAEPASRTGVWSDIRYGGVCAKRFIFGLNA
jgi:hypothetical protein